MKRRIGEIDEFQKAAAEWVAACFGGEVAADRKERILRFVEEALELAQADGLGEDELRRLTEYVLSRPAGEIGQEVGGVMITLAAYCETAGLSLRRESGAELARIEDEEVRRGIAGKWRQKKAARLTGNADLPGD